MGHGTNDKMGEGDWYENDSKVFDQDLFLRIHFSDNASIRMLKLIQPILESDKFIGIPKMIISQFCRGTFMNNEIAIADDLPTNIPPQTLNSQVILIVYACIWHCQMAICLFANSNDCEPVSMIVDRFSATWFFYTQLQLETLRCGTIKLVNQTSLKNFAKNFKRIKSEQLIRNFEITLRYIKLY